MGGDDRAYLLLVRRHAERVHRLALRLTGDAVRADDVTQDAFIRLHRALPGFRADATLSTWLHTVTLNLCRDLARRDRRDPTVPIMDETGATWEGPDGADAAEEAERRRWLERAVSSLPEPIREAVVLRYVAGLSYEAIADVARCPIGSAASRVHRGLRLMAKHLTLHGLNQEDL
ncbi:MAG: sigma-70 family RNA polymerase sigma factor [Gemmatimonadales bacterium]|nr:sigma-70 family RNA polymerase sigma factor [Gemmatimonadales bacterium]